MKHNWKYICRTKGYQSLKQAYCKDAHSSRIRIKADYYKMFRRIICAAERFAIREDTGIDDILNHWESMRDTSWWFGFYSNLPMVRRFKISSHPMGVRGTKKYYKKQHYSPELRSRRVQEVIRVEQKANSTRPKDRKPRWSNVRKKRMKEIREYQAQIESVS